MVAPMDVGATHPDYDAAVPQWARARDVLAGEDAVKAAGEKYLPRLDSQSGEEYAAYKARACFFGATARTLEEYLDLVFRRAPVVGFGGSGPELRAFVRDCDRWGLDFVRYARRVVGEVLAVGRVGSLVLWDAADGRPWVSMWRAKDILNWDVDCAGGRARLTGVVLREGTRVRVVRLVGAECFQEMWERGDEGLVLRERLRVTREGVGLTFVSFVFHGPRHSRPEPDRLPLADIIAANLDHYRLDADYKHGLHFAALPTAWVTGFDKGSALRIGSSTAWVSEVPGASAGFLEFSGAGLAFIEKAVERVERRMALLGARMLEVSEADGPRAAPAVGELSGLGSVVASLNQSLSEVLRMARWWCVGGDLGCDDVSFTMNTDLAQRPISGEGLAAVVAAWRAGAISRESMLALLKRGEVLPDGRTIAQERALIHGSREAVVG